MQSDRTIIVGAGVVGLTIAVTLQRAGIATLVVDAGGDRPPASWGNAGHIATEQVAPLASIDALLSAPRRLTLFGGALALPPSGARHWLPFGLRMAAASAPARFRAGRAALAGLMADVLPAWRQLVRDLGRPDLLIDGGHMVVWHDAAAARRGRTAWLSADLGPAHCRPATSGEIDRLAQLVRQRPVDGLMFSGSGQVLDPGGVLAALSDAFLGLGGERRTARATAIRVDDGRAAVVTDHGETLSGGTILIAAGVGSGALLAPLGVRVPIIAERGYHVQAAAHGWPDDLPPVVFEDRSMIVTRFASGLRAASVVELTADGAPPDPRHWRRLESHVAALGLPVAGPLARWHGSRPTLPDYLPAIGRAPAVGNLFYAFGHQHLGLTLAPVTAGLVLDMLRSGAVSDRLSPFSLARFA